MLVATVVTAPGGSNKVKVGAGDEGIPGVVPQLIRGQIRNGIIDSRSQGVFRLAFIVLEPRSDMRRNVYNTVKY
jgi:hypothetical protein